MGLWDRILGQGDVRYSWESASGAYSTSKISYPSVKDAGEGFMREVNNLSWSPGAITCIAYYDGKTGEILKSSPKGCKPKRLPLAPTAAPSAAAAGAKRIATGVRGGLTAAQQQAAAVSAPRKQFPWLAVGVIGAAVIGGVMIWRRRS